LRRHTPRRADVCGRLGAALRGRLGRQLCPGATSDEDRSDRGFEVRVGTPHPTPSNVRVLRTVCSAIHQAFPQGRIESAMPSGFNERVMADNQEDRIAALEAKVNELDTLVNLALRLIALEKPVSALLERFGATDVENR